MDKHNLLPGQLWKPAIRDAIKKSRYFVAIISKHSIDKRGFVQAEFKQGLETLEEFPESEIYVIPARLDDSKPTHEKLSELHWVDLFPDWVQGFDRILMAMNTTDKSVSNQRKWDTLGPERLEVGRMFDELPEGLVVAPSPLDCLDLHLLSAL
jgi:hypothetical protein